MNNALLHLSEGFEPAHTATETVALTSELRELGSTLVHPYDTVAEVAVTPREGWKNTLDTSLDEPARKRGVGGG